jgi:hypothetical protein
MSTLDTITFDPKAAVNSGIVFPQGAPTAKAAKDDNGKWNNAYLAPTAVTKAADGSVSIPGVVILVTSTGAATPATVTGFLKVSTNGNYLVTIARQKDAITATAKAARAEANTAAKAAWKTNGPTAPAAIVAPVVTIAGQAATAPAVTAPAVTVAPTKAEQAVEQAGSRHNLTAADIAMLRESGFGLGAIMDMLSGKPDTAPAVTAPAVTIAKGSTPAKTGKAGTLAPKV